MKRLAVLAAAAVACAALAVPALAATKTVTVGDDFFRAKNLKVKKGTTVRWVWKGKSPHNVSVSSGPQKFRSQVQTSGTYSKRLSKAGRYQIVCTIHPGMEQTITVR